MSTRVNTLVSSEELEKTTLISGGEDQGTKELGVGLSGPVLLAKQKLTGEMVAVKGLKKTDYYGVNTRFECRFTSSSLLSGEVLYFLHSFWVYFCIFFTRFECVFRG